MVRSLQAVAALLPSGEKAMQSTQPACPFSAIISLPVCASQILAILSELAVASRLPEGENVTEITESVSPSSEKTSFPAIESHTFTICEPAVANRLPSEDMAND